MGWAWVVFRKRNCKIFRVEMQCFEILKIEDTIYFWMILMWLEAHSKYVVQQQRKLFI